MLTYERLKSISALMQRDVWVGRKLWKVNDQRWTDFCSGDNRLMVKIKINLFPLTI